MENVLSEDKARLSAIVESSQDAIISKKLDGTITSWNDSAYKIFGYTSDEIVGKNISLIIPDDLLSEEADIIRKVKKGERIEHYKTVRKDKDGNVVLISLSISPIKDEQGNVVGVSKIARNITEQKVAEEKQAMLAAIVDSSDDAIVSKNLDGIITSWNKGAEKMFVYTEKEIIGKHITLIIPERLREEENYIIAKIKKGEKVDHFTTIRQRKDGSEFNISITVSPIKDKDGIVIGASKIAKDISEQRHSEEKQSILAAIVDSSDDAIISKNLDGIITSWNKGAEKIFLYTEQEAIGKHITLIIPERLRQEENYIIGQIKQGERVDHFETIRQRKDGSELNISITVSPVKDKGGKVIGASKIARDISEKIEAERQRAIYMEKLQELNKYKDEFMAMASHELKTPLTVIKANLQILEYRMSADENTTFLQRTLASVNKLGDLITNLLDVSKIQTGKLELDQSSFDIDSLLKEVVENIQQTTSTHRITCKHCGDKLMVYADKERMEQVIVNMLTNAVKYSPSGGDITVDSKKADGKVIVSIEDLGIGIPQHDLDKIFIRFFRVHGLASTFSGSGIGLYISMEIVKAHGGEMWVESELEKGSTFYFSLPAAE